ncbi:unnamed protein product [Periconia digitata]|uniref:Uncharacterized protein n=1 Tax=Periconia digitata TaxID=1303443 RepID=A0A9W4UH69_9PLEO|nr:unnamed protein product [Periconia digitata]
MHPDMQQKINTLDIKIRSYVGIRRGWPAHPHSLHIPRKMIQRAGRNNSILPCICPPPLQPPKKNVRKNVGYCSVDERGWTKKTRLMVRCLLTLRATCMFADVLR